MDFETYFQIRETLYRSSPAGYYACGGCGREIATFPQHTRGCVVGLFERRFSRPEYREQWLRAHAAAP